MLTLALDKPVIDKTGIQGTFDIELESAVTGTRLAQFAFPGFNELQDSAAPGPSIFTALQEQLGLKLESSKGPVEVLVIDSVQKPSEN
jgi:uncharacterized protein (TIGR03435 family)